MLVKITKELIDNDRYVVGNRCRTCPVAKAIKPLVKPEYAVSVVGAACYLYLGDIPNQTEQIMISLPRFVKDRIGAMDSGIGTDPFDFEISIPAEYRA